MVRRIVLYIILIACFSGTLFVMSMIPSQTNETALSNSMVRESTIRRVQVMPVVPQPLEETILLPGTVEAKADVTVGAAIPGILEKVQVNEGEFVTKGQELFQIDLRARQAMLEEARAANELAQKNLQRMRALRERGNVTAQDLDQAISQELQTAATVKRLEVDVSLGHVKASRNGFIDRVYVEEGEYMHEGGDLARLLAIDVVEVLVGVPEKHADAISQQETAVVLIESLQEQRTAQIERVAYGAELSTNTFEAKLVMDNPDFRVRPGMIVRAELVTRHVEDALLIPLFALVKSEKGMKVFVEQDNHVEERFVELGAFEKNMVEIRNGLNAGESVVVIGQRDLIDGQTVKVMERITPDSLPAQIEVAP